MSFDLVFFGGTGDLTWRKLMPALFQAFRHGKLPEGGRILAVARDDRSDDEYRAFIRERFSEVEPSKRPNEDEFARFAALLHYRRMDLSQPADYAGLKLWLDERNADTAVLYLATSPHLFPAICEQLGAAGLNHGKVRVVLEKPLGHDLASAQEINRVVRSVFSEQQAFRSTTTWASPACRT
jgi:glucose-6-phosphate 1-dehydrogenase